MGHWCSSRCLAVPGGQGRTLPFSSWKWQQLSRREPGRAVSPPVGISSVLALRHWRAVGSAGAAAVLSCRARPRSGTGVRQYS